MRKEEVLLLAVFLCLLLIPLISSASIDSEIQKITHYAEEYETGNINYAQLLIYLGSGRQKLNEILGATDMEQGGKLKQEQLRDFLGEPTKETNWVWAEKEEREVKINYDVPVWEKIIFDGNKIQMKLNAYPSLFGEEKELVYDLNFFTEFKRPKEQLDMESKIANIKGLAELFNLEPTSDNARNLARESVVAEKAFESYFRQSGEKCEDVMNSIFGAENLRESQQMIVYEIDFFSGENFETMMRLEMCDECEWNWINLDFWLEGRGPGFKGMEESKMESVSAEQFFDKGTEYFQSEIAKTLDEIKQALEQGDFKKAHSYKSKLWALNEAWNRKSNEVWQQVDEMFKAERENQNPEEMKDFDWKAFDNKRKEKEMELRRGNYEERKGFYLNLFSSNNIKEINFAQKEYEKRLVEEFLESGQEICDNNVDDNKDEKADCLDSLCAGKICGRKEIEVVGESQTARGIQDMFCISEMCQLPKQVIEGNVTVCGNHICENGEGIENCAEDCSSCSQHEALECAGRVMFKGTDERGCSLEPICVEEDESCLANEDCSQPLCGKAECVEGKCKFTELSECRESQCVDGDEKVVNCETGERLVTGTCIEGVWRNIEVSCTGEAPGLEEVVEQDIVGDDCSVREDCGGEDDVCSNGRCNAIPQIIQVEPEQQPPEEPSPEETSEPETPEQEEPEPSPEPETPVTGESILKLFKTIVGKVTGKITGYQVEEPGEPPEQPPEEPGEPEIPTQETCNPEIETCNTPDRPESGTCPEDIQQCPDGSSVTRNPDNNCEFNPCQQPPGQEGERPEDFEEHPQEEFSAGGGGGQGEQPEMPKMEKGVFKVGGACRTALQRTEAFIYFDGWGEPFEDVHKYKQEFYSAGGDREWCKYELENLQKQRKEFENSFDEDFVRWFFEDYLANSAKDWEQYVSGIFEMYWKNVDNIINMAHRMNCLDIETFEDYNLINVKYESEFGTLEFWEELKTAKVPGMDKSMELITPYMKIWIFPNREFMQYEMEEAMKNHEFPGPPEEKMKMKNEKGLTSEEREELKQDRGLMDKIRKIAEQYGGNADVVIQFMDYNTNRVVFNLYAKINEEDILTLEPMPPEEVPEKDITIELDFDKIYDLILFTEKEMRGAELESPPWDRKPRSSFVKGIIDGVKIWFKVRDIANSAKVSPESAKGDAMDLFQTFFKMFQQGDGQEPENEQGQEEQKADEIWETNEEITGNMIMD